MNIKVLKFGGASVKDAQAVKNVAQIISNKFSAQKTIIVFSAMGKTTNAFEELTNKWFNKTDEYMEVFNDLKKYHLEIIENLFEDRGNNVFHKTNLFFEEIETKIHTAPSENYNYEYDQLVSYGELLSTTIISEFLKKVGINNTWIDVRDYIKTDSSYREAKIDWNLTQYLVKKFLLPNVLENNNNDLIITQGFIGGTTNNSTTTLGREGSDFTASVFAYCTDAQEVQIWKDVPGLLNADPKCFDKTEKIDSISFQDTIELAYYGAKIIHPKTIKPLQNKNIPLLVKSFNDPNAEGTIICKDSRSKKVIPSFIFKFDQILLSISTKDFSFIAEDNLEKIFGLLSKHHLKINMMQNSAISFSLCIDNDQEKISRLTKDLKTDFYVKYNDRLELITIRHYNQESINKVLKNRSILLEQTSRSTIQMIVENG